MIACAAPLLPSSLLTHRALHRSATPRIFLERQPAACANAAQFRRLTETGTHSGATAPFSDRCWVSPAPLDAPAPVLHDECMPFTLLRFPRAHFHPPLTTFFAPAWTSYWTAYRRLQHPCRQQHRLPDIPLRSPTMNATLLPRRMRLQHHPAWRTTPLVRVFPSTGHVLRAHMCICLGISSLSLR